MDAVPVIHFIIALRELIRWLAGNKLWEAIAYMPHYSTTGRIENDFGGPETMSGLSSLHSQMSYAFGRLDATCTYTQMRMSFEA